MNSRDQDDGVLPGTAFTRREALAAIEAIDAAIETDVVFAALRETGYSARVDQAVLILHDFIANARPVPLGGPQRQRASRSRWDNVFRTAFR